VRRSGNAIRATLALVLLAPGAPAIAQSDTARPRASDVLEQRARAQALRAVARADSLLRSGRVALAESLYYDAARRRPRDPAPRLALGRYLASRGALRIGAVLIEEARRFGANPAAVAVHLAPLYTQLGAWQSLRELSAAPLTSGERERAQWIGDRMSAIAGPESATVALLVARAPGALGAVVIRMGASDSVVADIDPAARGIVIDHSRRTPPSLRRFAGGSTDVRQMAGLIEQASIGDVAFTNLPVTFASLGDVDRARIGLDFLSRFSPTLDRARGRVILRRTGRLGARPPGTRYPLFVDAATGARVPRAGRLDPLVTALGAELRARSWTIDARLGELVLHR
jgi:hypothetical protein